MFASSFLFLFFAVGVFVLVKAGDGFVKRVPVNRRAPFLVYADDILESRRAKAESSAMAARRLLESARAKTKSAVAAKGSPSCRLSTWGALTCAATGRRAPSVSSFTPRPETARQIGHTAGISSPGTGAPEYPLHPFRLMPSARLRARA